MALTRIKICCIGSVEEAWAAIDQGACAVGLVSEMPSGPGMIPEVLIAEIVAALPPGIGSFLLTSQRDTAKIVVQQKTCRVNAVQLCDRLAPGTHGDLRHALPGVSLVQVIHVGDEGALEEALRVASHVDALLLDSGTSVSPVKRLGGTGETHDWATSREIRDRVGVPVFLAGGLTPENVGDAIRRVRPFGVDVCTGVRTDGRLDRAKLRAFVAAVQSATGGEE
jgi:phosphoribosylanthranilate isomerase